MNVDALLPLLHNAALLVATAVVFDTAPTRVPSQTHSLNSQLGHGLALAAVAAVAMLTPWVVVPGVVFDARSVVIGLSALFFGTVTTMVVVVVAALVRVSQGGVGALPAVVAMIGVTSVGLLWRHRLRTEQADLGPLQLWLVGFTTHVAVLLAMLLLPWPTAFQVLRAIGVPMLVIMPTATMLVGLLFVRRLKRERAKRALAETFGQHKVLHHELQHRVKNSLSMIVAMISLQREKYHNGETREALAELSDRVSVMAQLYGQLYQSAATTGGVADKVQIQPLLTTVCDSLGNSLGHDGITVRSHIDDVELEAGKATSLGIIANELTTNALKHAFPVRDPSTVVSADSQVLRTAVHQPASVEVSFSQAHGEYMLEVSDTGIGLPDDFSPPSSAGFGLELVHMLTEQLNGSFSFECASAPATHDSQANRTGAVFRVVFPA